VADLAGGKTGQLGGRTTPCHPLATGLVSKSEQLGNLWPCLLSNWMIDAWVMLAI
jgi:hypothetical protein